MSGLCLEAVQEWQHELALLSKRLAPRFVRAEPRKRSLAYLRGLLAPLERRNGWQLAEHAGERTPDGMQRLLSTAEWNADDVRDDLRCYVLDHLGPGGVLVVDKTGFIKKGTKSAGVKRQYSGTAGGIDNCQLGVFLAYTTEHGSAFIDRELFLPQEWVNDNSRRDAARIPQERVFQTKAELGLAMIERALNAEVKPAWVTGDSVYSAAALRRSLEARQQPYVLATATNAVLRFLENNRLRIAELPELFAELGKSSWQRRSAGVGSKGEREFDWAWISFRSLGLTDDLRPANASGFDKWILARRSVDKPEEMAYYRVFAPIGTTLDEVVRAAGTRWSIEVGFEQAKNDAGLDEYEVRSWVGWHRHVTLSLFAYALLVAVRAGHKKGAFGEATSSR
ncbi:IS701 family transposase [Deinococcus peraridilitoris]|uniref:IS701 family transposase n=1 Tax=Deinococcus peraridilitoris TaxID=432329 RepID=UPI0002F14FB8|nr:IS701 family transposase [Deinococcus peraridilitoris]